mmetsp:Transcript_10987/g.17912  ORF Transcript_10987/g.17912 Transcript_10987/m.17912 type:complete len:85 (-) Transcript_10987:115-369(-)
MLDSDLAKCIVYHDKLVVLVVASDDFYRILPVEVFRYHSAHSLFDKCFRYHSMHDSLNTPKATTKLSLQEALRTCLEFSVTEVY